MAVNDKEYYYENDDAVCGYYRLTADSTLNGCSHFDNWGECPPELNRTPIGYELPFMGCFDGDGHTIGGLYIHQAAEQLSSGLGSSCGLFGSIDGGEIKNLHIENAFVHPLYVQDIGGTEIGILAGNSNSAITGAARWKVLSFVRVAPVGALSAEILAKSPIAASLEG